jgi:hypothetical protein
LPIKYLWILAMLTRRNIWYTATMHSVIALGAHRSDLTASYNVSVRALFQLVGAIQYAPTHWFRRGHATAWRNGLVRR